MMRRRGDEWWGRVMSGKGRDVCGDGMRSDHRVWKS
jgi:hypothetical protein